MRSKFAIIMIEAMIFTGGSLASGWFTRVVLFRISTRRKASRKCRIINSAWFVRRSISNLARTMLDLGCGWGTLAAYASSQYGANVTGITLGRNQTAWGNKAIGRALDSSPHKSNVKSEILCMDYRDTPSIAGGYKKITCLEMAEHVGVRHFGTFLRQVYDMMDDDGLFFLQIAGLRKSWQFEDLVWVLSL